MERRHQRQENSGKKFNFSARSSSSSDGARMSVAEGNDSRGNDKSTSSSGVTVAEVRGMRRIKESTKLELQGAGWKWWKL